MKEPLKPAPRRSGTATITLGLSDGTATTPVVLTVVVGTAAGETLNGSAGNDLLLGRGGRNTLKGNDGNDVLCGGGGNDRLTGGGRADLFSGGPGGDVATDLDPAHGDTQDGTSP